MKNFIIKMSAKSIIAGWLVAGFLIVAQPGMAQVITAPNTPSAITPVTQPVETGPILDVIPYVLADGYTINLALIPSVTEFVGYDTAPPIPNVTAGLNVVQLPVALPAFTVRQLVTTVNVWDNQTVVLGGLISSSVLTTKDKVPFLGDLPALGRFFQSQSKETIKKNLMIFVTATIVDPSGNRVHSDDDLPFAMTSIPTQPENAGKMKESVQKITMPQGGAAVESVPAAE